MVRKILIAGVKGTCAGVDRALKIIEGVLRIYGRAYVTHEPVHNKLTSQDLQADGMIFVNDVSEVPPGEPIVFSAHGTHKGVIQRAIDRGLIVIDAACPLVSKVHKEAIKYESDERTLLIIGTKDHQEIIGLLGQLHESAKVFVLKTVDEVMNLDLSVDTKIAYVTQTTLNTDDVRLVIESIYSKFRDVVGPGLKDVCFATKNRQDSVKELCELVSLVLVVGSQNSSNSRQLRDVAIRCGVESYLIDEIHDIDFKQVLSGHSVIGMTAGASVTDKIFNGVISTLLGVFPDAVVEKIHGVEENIVFHAPNMESRRIKFEEI